MNRFSNSFIHEDVQIQHNILCFAHEIHKYEKLDNTQYW